jgi:D-serine deaminase-like pyridoxal phosphate-dependent protein
MSTRLRTDDHQIDWRVKGFWCPGPPVADRVFAAARHDLFGGAFTWPILVARRTAIEHNIAALAAFCARHQLAFAPHGKTTMAPSLFAAQLRAGAWGMTVATANQALSCRAFGVPRVMLANELLDPTALRWAAREVARGFEFVCQVDSLAAVHAIEAATRTAAATGAQDGTGARPLRVLVELGHAGGRAGCRSVDELTEVARAAAAAPGVELAGVAAYEGGLPRVAEVADYLDTVRAATRSLSARGLLPASVLVAAGGSAYFDVVAERLGGAWLPGHTLHPVLRAGAYVSHDDGFYRERTPLRRVPEQGSLDAALEVWAQVLSTPEPGLAIVGMGKRDVPYDEGLPVPRWLRRPGGALVDATALRVARLNDHHTYVDVAAGVPADRRPRPGDLICFGISHPCTAFDKWQVIPVIEDDHTVSDLLRTYF